MLSEVTRLKDIIKTNGSSSNVQAALGSFFEKLGDFDSAKHHLEKAVLLNSDNPGFFLNLLIFWTTLIRSLYCILETSKKQTNLSFIFLSCLRFWTQMASRESQQAGQSSERPKVSLAQSFFIVQFVHASISESKHRPILFAKIMQL